MKTRLGKPVSKTNRLTKRHLTGFAQLAVLAPLHLLIRQDFLQRPRQKHALRFTVFCLWKRLLLLWRPLLLLLHFSVLLSLLSQAVIVGLVLRISRWRGKLTKARLSVSVQLSCYLSSAPPCCLHVTSRDSQLSGFWLRHPEGQVTSHTKLKSGSSPSIVWGRHYWTRPN